jgi:hypothetical protein
MVRNFRFEEPGVALSGVPETPEAVDWLYDQGIRSVISLHPVLPEVEERLKERGIPWMHYPIEDFARGVPPGLRLILRRIHRAAQADPAVLIH